MHSLVNFRNKIIICLCLALMTSAMFGIAVTYDFVNYDDKAYITGSNYVRAGLSVRGVTWAFTTILQDHGHWHPLTLLSHMLDCQLFGLNPAGHHFTSILFHVLNTILLFVVLERMTKALWPSALVAALFALHPLHVEPVAWIASRKDVLSTFFMLMTLWAYVSYTERPGIGKYFLALSLFAAGLLSKSILVTLPFIMILLDYWPLGRLFVTVSEKKRHKSSSIRWRSRIFWEKLPFLLLSVIVGAVTLLGYQASWTGEAISSDTTHSFLPFAERFIDVSNGYAQYIWKMFWPTNLSIIYQQNNPVPNWQSILSLAFLIGISFLCFRNIKKRPYLVVGWLWFLGMLLPISGIFNTGPRLSADRYTYASFIGLFIMLSWSILELSGKGLKSKRTATAAMVLILASCSILSSKQIRPWENGITLFTNAVTVNPHSDKAKLNLGIALYNAGQYKEATDHFSDAIKINPKYAEAYMQLGLCSARAGNIDKGYDHFLEAIKLNPVNPRIYYNYGIALELGNRMEAAFEQIKRALDIKPNYELARRWVNIYIGIKLYEDSKLEEAEELLKDVVRRFPKQSKAYLYLGLIASSKGQVDPAISYLLHAIKANPEYAEAHVNLGIALARKKEYAQAEKAFSDALKIEPNHVKAHYNYAVSLYLQDRRKEAMEQLAITLEIDPDYKKARDTLDALRGTNSE